MGSYRFEAITAAFRPWDIATAKAANWGYERVFFLVKGTRVWREAGYPVETAE